MDPFKESTTDNYADVILRSSDNVDFHVSRTLLGLSSAFFSDMFNLPQPGGEKANDIPVLDVTEHMTILDCLLKLIHPGIEDPPLPDVMAVGDVLKASMKYQMDVVTVRLRRTLSTFSNPLRVYTIACSCQLEQEALQAAVEWCEEDNFISYVDEMDQISAGCYFRLLRFRSGYEEGQGLPKSFRFCTAENNDVGTSGFVSSEAFSVPSPFHAPLLNTDVILRSIDRVDFYVNAFIISMASPKLAIILREASSASIVAAGAHHVVTLSEHSRVLLLLLQLTYPVTSPQLEEWDTVTAVLEAAERLELTKAAEIAKKVWLERIEAYPLRSYFVAVRNGWLEDARTAAKHCTLLSIDSYVPEMEAASARSYRQLLEYRKLGRKAVVEARRRFIDDSDADEGRGETYDVLWSDRELSHLLDYQLHATWALCGSSTACTTPTPLWHSSFRPSAVGLGGAWITVMKQLFTCLDAWHGHSGDLLDIIHYCDAYGGTAAEQLDKVELQL